MIIDCMCDIANDDRFKLILQRDYTKDECEQLPLSVCNFKSGEELCVTRFVNSLENDVFKLERSKNTRLYLKHTAHRFCHGAVC